MKTIIQNMVGYAYDHRIAVDWSKIIVNVNSRPCGGPSFTFPEEEFVKTYGGKMLGLDQFRKFTAATPRIHEL